MFRGAGLHADGMEAQRNYNRRTRTMLYTARRQKSALL